jgi:hypothetical protein
MICVIPFIAIFTAFILFAVYKLLMALSNFLSRKNLLKFKVSPESVFIIYSLALFLCFNPVGKIIDGYKYLTTYRESRTLAINYIKANYPNAKIGISKELQIHPSDLGKLKNKVLIDTESESLEGLYDKNLNYIISSDRHASFKKREGDADRINLLENKLPKENIIQSFGKNRVNLDIFSVEPKVNIYEVDESFLAVRED